MIDSLFVCWIFTFLNFSKAGSSLMGELHFHMLKIQYFYTAPLQINNLDSFRGGKVLASIWKVMLKSMQRPRAIQFTHLHFPKMFFSPSQIFCIVQFRFSLLWSITYDRYKCQMWPNLFSFPLAMIGIGQHQIKCGQICFGSPGHDRIWPKSNQMWPI